MPDDADCRLKPEACSQLASFTIQPTFIKKCHKITVENIFSTSTIPKNSSLQSLLRKFTSHEKPAINIGVNIFLKQSPVYKSANTSVRAMAIPLKVGLSFGETDAQAVKRAAAAAGACLDGRTASSRLSNLSTT